MMAIRTISLILRILTKPDKRKVFIDECMELVDAIADGLKPPYKIEKR